MRSTDEMDAAERALTAGGNPDRVRRRDRIAQSTSQEHGAALEAALRELCNLYRLLHEQTTSYLQGGGTPGKQNRSGPVRAADDVYNGALQALAAAFGVLYPDGEGKPTSAITEVEALVRHRVGRLCSGWQHNGVLVHHPAKPCDLHTDHS